MIRRASERSSSGIRDQAETMPAGTVRFAERQEIEARIEAGGQPRRDRERRIPPAALDLSEVLGRDLGAQRELRLTEPSLLAKPSNPSSQCLCGHACHAFFHMKGMAEDNFSPPNEKRCHGFP
jgi:hypothetical protein